MAQDFVTWLRAQFDQDEASEWPHRRWCQMFQKMAIASGWRPDPMSCNCDAAVTYMRDVTAKRLIVNELVMIRDRSQVSPLNRTIAQSIDLIGAYLALPYVDRPGYRSDWEPSRSEERT